MFLLIREAWETLSRFGKESWAAFINPKRASQNYKRNKSLPHSERKKWKGVQAVISFCVLGMWEEIESINA